MTTTDPKKNGKAPPARSARIAPLAPAITRAQQALLDWTNLRNDWISSDFTGFLFGRELPPLGPRPPDPPVRRTRR